jgi:two-component system chemotaxis response regulator CheY
MAPLDIDFSKLTVLVVEDQDYVRSLITQSLKRLGVGSILEEADGAGALRVLRNLLPDFVLCDIHMDPVDGLELLSQVRNGEEGVLDPHVPLVFLTSNSERGTVLAAIENEVDGYLIKPVSLNELKTKIISVLSKRKVYRWK